MKKLATAWLLLVSVAALAVDDDGDGVEDLGGTVLYSTSFSPADAGWAFVGLGKVNDPANARTPPYIAAMVCFHPSCGTFTMTFAYTVPRSSTLSFWAKLTSYGSSDEYMDFYVDGIAKPIDRSINTLAFKQKQVIIPAGSHTFKWDFNRHPYVVDDVTITTIADNCPMIANADQLDTNHDGQGNVCDDNDDGDGIMDVDDNCPLNINTDQLDTDADGQGNACDSDDDNDGVSDSSDAFDFDPAEWLDTDSDGAGNNADTDDDNDGVADISDNCLLNANAEQLNTDGDAPGNVCDSDDDNDGVLDGADKFPLDASESLDADNDGTGNNADTDDDNDDVQDVLDNCLLNANTDQLNTDGDAQGNVCDVDDDNDGVADAADKFPLDPTESLDADNDAVGDNADNCPLNGNTNQLNTDADAQGNVCDNDDDNDGVTDGGDKFPFNNAASVDGDNDGYPDTWNVGCNAVCQQVSALVLDDFPTNPCGAIDTDHDGKPDALLSCFVVLEADSFETGNFSAWPWTTGGNANWFVQNTGKHSGSFSARSGSSLTQGQTSWLQLAYTSSAATKISFWVAAASSSGIGSPQPQCNFYVDAVKVGSCVNLAWNRFEFNTSPGAHTYKWEFIKGAAGTVSATYLDDVSFHGVSLVEDADDDNDGIPDEWEIQYGLNPLVNDAGADPDGDDVPNINEYRGETNPLVSNGIPYDFDGDGDADILLRNTSTGQNVVWLLENGAKAGTSTLTTNAQTSEVAAILDGDRDADADILWYDATLGKLIFWQMQNGVKQANAFLGNTTATLSVVGDFDGDGDPDILLKTSTGAIKVWTLENMTVALATTIGTPAVGYEVIDSGDFNGDGIDDIVMQDIAGAVRIWQLNSNAQLASTIDVASINLAYALKKSGDTDNDGDDDLVFRNDVTGQTIVWQMQNGARVSANVISGLNPSMSLASVTDFDQDGDEDLMFRDTTAGDASDGNTIIWKMQNNTKESNSFLGNNAVTFILESTLDMDGDGDGDILYRDNSTGQIIGWNMQSGTKAGNYNLGNTSINWELRF